MRPCLKRCKHCRIYFITDPRNRSRNDLGCPFGCRDAHRKASSNKRSSQYYQTDEGKQKKKQLNDRRKDQNGSKQGPADNSAIDQSISDCRDTHPKADSNEDSRCYDKAGEATLKTRQVNSSRKAPEGSEQDPANNQVIDPAMTGNRDDHSNAGGKESSRSHDQDDDGDRSKQNAADSVIFCHIRMVVSLIERRAVARIEIVELLRQHSMDLAKKPMYKCANLKKQPP